MSSRREVEALQRKVEGEARETLRVMGRKLEARARSLKWSAEQVALVAGISPTTVRAVFRDPEPTAALSMALVAAVLDVDCAKALRSL